MDLVWYFLGALVILAGILAGHSCRKAIHAVYFVHDPIFWTLSFGCLAAWIWMSTEGMDCTEFMVIAGAFIIGYLIGFTLCNAGDVLDITTYTEAFPGGYTERITTYFKLNKTTMEFNQFWMPQHLSRVFMALIGFRNPLIMDKEIQRTFNIGQTNGLWTLTTKSVSIQTSKTEAQDKGIIGIGHKKIRNADGVKVKGPKRYLINATILALTLIPATICVEDRVTFLKESGAYIDATHECARLRSENAQLRIDVNSSKYAAAGQMIEDMFSDLDAPETEIEVLKRIEAERKKRVNDDMAA